MERIARQSLAPRKTRRETKGNRRETSRHSEQQEGRQDRRQEGGHNDQQEPFTCVPQLWTAVSTSASQSFTCVSQLWALDCCIHLCLAILKCTCVSQLSTAISASALHFFVFQLWTSQTLVAQCLDYEKHKLFGVYGGVIVPKQFSVRGSQFFLKMCPPFLSLLVSVLFRWPCSISIHSPSSLLFWFSMLSASRLQPLLCNPLHVSPSSGLLCPALQSFTCVPQLWIYKRSEPVAISSCRVFRL